MLTASAMIRFTSRITGASFSSSWPSPLEPLRSPESSAKSMAVSVNSCNIESTDSVSWRARPVVLVDRLDDRFLGCQRDLDLPVQHEPELVDRLEVHRVGHDDLDGPVFLGHGHDEVFPGERLGDQLDDRGGNLHLVKVDVVHAELFGLGLHDLFHVGVAQLLERLLDGQVAHPLGLIELVGADDASANEDFGPVFGLLGHDWGAPAMGGTSRPARFIGRRIDGRRPLETPRRKDHHYGEESTDPRGSRESRFERTTTVSTDRRG